MSKPLRVLSIAHTAVSRDAGRLRYHPLGHDPALDIHLVVPERWQQFGRTIQADPPNDPGITVHVLPIRWPAVGRAKWYLHTYPGISRLIDALQPDVIHLWEEPWSLVALQAAWLRRRRCKQAALVLEVDQNILKRLPPPFGLIRRYVLRETDLAFSRGRDATNVLRACGFEGPAVSIGYGVDLGVFKPGPVQGTTAALRIGYVGRIVPEKGLDDAIDALAAMHGDGHLAIMGEGPHEAALRSRAAALGVGDRLSIRGWAEPAEVASFIRAQDLTVLLTRTDGAVREQFGRVILESQACGVPVIGSSSGAIPNVIGAGGWVVAERDGSALAQLLDALCLDRAQVSARGQAGLENVSRRFTFDAVARILAQGWNQAADDRAQRLRLSRMWRGNNDPSNRHQNLLPKS